MNTQNINCVEDYEIQYEWVYLLHHAKDLYLHCLVAAISQNKFFKGVH